MSLVSVSEFLTEYPRFQDKGEFEIEAKLKFAENNFCPLSVWRDRAADGIKLMAAHLLEMDWLQTAQTVSAAANTAAGKGLPSLSSSGDDLTLTSFGRQFQMLQNTIPAFPLVL